MRPEFADSQRRNIVSPTVIGLFTGLLLGLGWTMEGFPGLAVVALLGALGFVVGRVIEGELDLTQYLGGRDSRRGQR
jgi:hypothetical protein